MQGIVERNHRFHLGKENNNNLLTNESLSVSPHLITFEYFGGLEMLILIHERPTRLRVRLGSRPGSPLGPLLGTASSSLAAS